jgi:hypothetical protein
MLAKVLGRSLRVNSPNSDHDGILHAASPNHPVFARLDVRRAIYVYANPPEAILSLFNRDYQSRMVAKLNSIHRNRSEYIRNVRSDSQSLAFLDLLNLENDPFQVRCHLQNWTTAKSASFPILCIKYDAIFRSKQIIADFVERADVADRFPEWRPRSSRLNDLKPSQRDALLQLYRKECELYDALPDAFEIPVPG